MKPIVVCVDGSEPSLHAFAKGSELARALTAPVVLAYVSPPVLLSPMTYGETVQRLIEEDQRAGSELLERLAAPLRSAGLQVSTRVLLGSVADAIADLAKTLDAQLVVVGSRGKNAVRRVLLGSVADRLVHISSGPVLVVR